MTKPVLAVDLDDTLAASIEATLAHVSKILGVQMKRGNIADVAYWAKYGIDDSEAIRLVQDYSLKGCPGLLPLPGAVESIARLKQKYRLFVVTARDEQIQESTKTWIAEYFPDMFEELIHVGNPFVSKDIRPKEDVCRELGALWLIDDSLNHAKAAAAQGTKAILFGGHDWHVDVEPQPNLYLAHDWEAVDQLLFSESR